MFAQESSKTEKTKMSSSTLTVKSFIRNHKIKIKKSYSQNFILNPSLANKFTKHLDLSCELIIEVGPGVGSITHSLLNKSSPNTKILAIEKDVQFMPILQELSTQFPQKFYYLHEDVMNVSDQQILEKTQLHYKKDMDVQITGNLPFGSASHILKHWLKKMTDSKSILSSKNIKYILMFQKEVAENLVAIHHSPNRTRSSVLVESLCDASILLNVPSHVFYPKPKVDASILCLKPHHKQFMNGLNFDDFVSFVNVLFSCKRKMIRNNLRTLTALDVNTLDERIATKRAQDLTLNEIVDLYKMILK